MEFFVNPSVAYLLIVTAVFLLLLTAAYPKFALWKVGMVVCLGAAGFEFAQLHGNPWALLVAALSPLPFFIAMRQPGRLAPLAIVAIVMMTIGPVFIFVDAQGRLNQLPLAGLVGLVYGRITWIVFQRLRETRRKRLSDDPDSLIGLVGTVRSAIEKFEIGLVEFQGEVWVARSAEAIPAGSLVRIVRFDGLVLTVEKVENLTRNKTGK